MTVKPCARHTSGAHFVWINQQPHQFFLMTRSAELLLSDESQAMSCGGAIQAALHAIQVTLCTVVGQVNKLTFFSSYQLTCHMVLAPFSGP